MKKLLITAITIIAIVLVSGCDLFQLEEEDTGTAPRIIDAAFFEQGQYESEVSNLVNDGSTLYELLIAIEDPDLDADILHLTETGPDDYSNTGSMELASQSSVQGSYTSGGSTVEPPYGTYKLELQVEDKEGNLSNEFRIFYDIVEP